MIRTIAESVKKVAVAVTEPKGRPLSDAERKEMERTIAQWAKTDPEWQQKIKEVAEQKVFASSLPKAVALAIMTLLPSLGSAQEIIKQVKPQVQQTQQAVIPTKADLDSVRDAIPDPGFNVFDKTFLLAGGPFDMFRNTMEGKISKGMDSVGKVIKSNPRLSVLPKEKLARIIAEQFEQKVKLPQYAKDKALLDGYLSKVDKNMDDVNRIVDNHLVMHWDSFKIC